MWVSFFPKVNQQVLKMLQKAIISKINHIAYADLPQSLQTSAFIFLAREI